MRCDGVCCDVVAGAHHITAGLAGEPASSFTTVCNLLLGSPAGEAAFSGLGGVRDDLGGGCRLSGEQIVIAQPQCKASLLRGDLLCGHTAA